MKRKYLAILLCIIMIVTCFAGCGSSSPAPSTGDNSSAPATSDSTSADSGIKKIVYANGGQPPYLDYQNGNAYAKYGILKSNIFTGLCRISKDGVAELGYAEDYSVSDDGLVWTFKLRENAKFSDGTPMTAHDWVDTMKWYCAPETAAMATTLEEYVAGMTDYVRGEGDWDAVGYKALDDYTLEITLAAPCTYFLDIVCTYVALPMYIINDNPDWFKKAETYVCNGPFRMAEFQDNVHILLEKNPYYYDAENVKIDQVDFVFVDDAAVEFASYSNGDIDVSDALSAEAVAKMKDSEEFLNADRIGTAFVTVNTNRIADPRIRQALSIAVNREVVLQVLGSTAHPATGLVPYGIHWGDKQFREVAGDPIQYNPEKAKELLAEAGYPNGEGLPTYKYYCQNDADSMNQAQILQSMWKEIGVNFDIVSLEPSTYWDIFDTEDWDIADDGWTGDYDDPSTNLFLWEHRREMLADGTLNDARWVDDAALKYDELMQSTYVETDYETRMKTFVEAEKILAENAPIIPIKFQTDPILVNPKVKDVVKCYIGHVFFQYADIVE